MVSAAGISVISSRTIRTAGSASTACVTPSAKCIRSTARQAPAGTRVASATRMTSEPRRRISSLSSPTAVSSVALRKEFEHTSSARRSVVCASVPRRGRISWRSTRMPRRASCQAASQPASPPPIMVTRSVIIGSGGGGPPRRVPPRGGRLAAAGPPAAPHLRRRAPLGQRRVVAAVAGVDLLLPAAALLHAAAHGAVALGQLLGHEPRPAARTGLGQRPVPGHELARGIAAAAVQELAAPRAALHELALAAAEQAPNARGHGLVEGLHVLALGIARAAEELAVAAEATVHGPAALLAHLVRGLGLDRSDGPVVGALEVHRVLALGVAAAGEELAPPAPLDDHRLPALLAHEVGRALLALHVAHQDLGLLEVPGEWPPEATERVDVVLLALLDAVELVLHAGRELDVQYVGERLDQEVGHQEAQVGRFEAPPVVLDHVLLVEDGAHDAGIGGRAPDALLLELLDERGLREAGRRLREVLLGDQLEEAQPVALGERRELALALLLGIALLVVAALGVDADEAVEHEDLAGGPEAAGTRLDVHRGGIVDGRFHLARHEAVPDERVERELVLVEVRRDALGLVLHRGRPDRLVRVLRVLLRAVHLRRLGQVRRAVAALDVVARGGERFARDARRVGAHVGDEADRALRAELDAFVEALRDPHGARGLEAELARRLLLEARGDEGRRRVAAPFLALDLGDGPVGASEPREHLVHARLRVEAKALVVELLARHLGEPRREGRRLARLEPRLDRPVLLVRERADLTLVPADDPAGGRPHAARREPAAHLVPEQRRELVADQPVEDAARLLRVEAVAVELAGLLERLEDRLLRDLVEQHAVDVLRPRAELLRDVPGDGFALAVGVGRQVDVLLVLGRLLDVLEHLRLALDDVVLGREVALDVDPELRLGQVHHVADGGLHLVVPPEVLAERLGLGRRLDDDEVLGHVLHAARRRKRLPGSWQTRPRSSSARSVSSAAPGGTAAWRITSSTCRPSGPIAARICRSGALSAASAAATRRAASRGSSSGQSSSTTSSARVMSMAPCWISRFGPRCAATPTGPGTANTCRSCSRA